MKASEQQIEKLLEENFHRDVGEALRKVVPHLRWLSDFLDDLTEKTRPHPKMVAMQKRLSYLIYLIEVGEIPKEKRS